MLRFAFGLLALALATAVQADDKTVAMPTLKIFAMPPVKAAATDTAIQKLCKERYEVLRETLALQMKFIDAGSWDVNALSNVYTTATSSQAAYLALEPTKAEGITMLENQLEFAQHIEAIMKKRLEAGSLKKQDYLQAMCFRMEAEIQLLKAK